MSTQNVSAPNEEVTALHAQVRHCEFELAERNAVIAQGDAMIERLHEQVRLLLARRFAPSSEKIPDEQLGLFNDAEATDLRRWKIRQCGGAEGRRAVNMRCGVGAVNTSICLLVLCRRPRDAEDGDGA